MELYRTVEIAGGGTIPDGEGSWGGTIPDSGGSWRWNYTGRWRPLPLNGKSLCC